jgi:hypothetical protein
MSTLNKNLIYVGTIAHTGNIVIFSNMHCWILNNLDSRNLEAIGHRDLVNALYKFEFQHQINNAEIGKEFWHRKFGHLNYLGFSHLSKHSRIL